MLKPYFKDIKVDELNKESLKELIREAGLLPEFDLATWDAVVEYWETSSGLIHSKDFAGLEKLLKPFLKKLEGTEATVSAYTTMYGHRIVISIDAKGKGITVELNLFRDHLPHPERS